MFHLVFGCKASQCIFADVSETRRACSDHVTQKRKNDLLTEFRYLGLHESRIKAVSFLDLLL